jgi:hypothetical protein
MTAEDEGGRSPATLVCRPCGLRFPAPRDFQVHLERHREVKPAAFDRATGKEISHACPAGCGRSFPTLLEYRDHAPVCDGEPPLPPLDGKLRAETEGEPRALFCPECRIRIDDPGKLGSHIERHREPQASFRGSRPCPKGCGRNLKGHDLKNHAAICDGEPPLPAGRPERKHKGESMDPKFHCEDCGKDFERPNALAIHRKFKHAGAGTPRPKEARGPQGAHGEAGLPSASGLHSGVAVMNDLREEADRLRKKADRLDELVKTLEEESLL